MDAHRVKKAIAYKLNLVKKMNYKTGELKKFHTHSGSFLSKSWDERKKAIAEQVRKREEHAKEVARLRREKLKK